MFCFPYAGVGVSAFREWWAWPATDIEICCLQIPGRESRIREPPFKTVSALVPPLVAALTPWLERPYVFFGHSLGALIAFEAANAVRRAGLRMPKHLYVSASHAPQLPWPYPAVHDLDDMEFLSEVHTRYESVPQQVFQDPDLRSLILPGLRADFALVETYRYIPKPALDCPISAFGGDQDATVPADSLTAWRHQTKSTFRMQILPGKHFFLNAVRPRLTQLLADELSGG